MAKKPPPDPIDELKDIRTAFQQLVVDINRIADGIKLIGTQTEKNTKAAIKAQSDMAISLDKVKIAHEKTQSALLTAIEKTKQVSVAAEASLEKQRVISAERIEALQMKLTDGQVKREEDMAERRRIRQEDQDRRELEKQVAAYDKELAEETKAHEKKLTKDKLAHEAREKLDSKMVERTNLRTYTAMVEVTEKKTASETLFRQQNIDAEWEMDKVVADQKKKLIDILKSEEHPSREYQFRSAATALPAQALGEQFVFAGNTMRRITETLTGGGSKIQKGAGILLLASQTFYRASLQISESLGVNLTAGFERAWKRDWNAFKSANPFAAGPLVSSEQQAKTGGAFNKTFGSVLTVPLETSLTQAARLINLTGEEFIGGIRGFIPIVGNFDRAQALFTSAVKVFNKEGLTSREAAQFVVANQELVARYTGTAASDLLKAAAAAKQAGFSLEKLQGFSDSIVTDFGSFLDSAAELSALGMNLPIAELGQAALTGGAPAVLDVLKNTLGDLTQLTQAQQVVLSKSLNIPLSELMAIKNSDEIGQSVQANSDAAALKELSKISMLLEKITAVWQPLVTFAVSFGQSMLAYFIAAKISKVTTEAALEKITSSFLAKLAGVGSAGAAKGLISGGASGASGYAIRSAAERLAARNASQAAYANSGSAIAAVMANRMTAEQVLAQNAGKMSMSVRAAEEEAARLARTSAQTSGALSGLGGTALRIGGVLAIAAATIYGISKAAQLVHEGKTAQGVGLGSIIGAIGLTAAAALLAIPTGGLSLAAAGAIAGGGAVLGGGAAYLKGKSGDDVISQPGYGSRLLQTDSGTLALNNKDTVVAYADDAVSQPKGMQLLSKGALVDKASKSPEVTVNMDSARLESKLDSLLHAIAAMKSGDVKLYVDGRQMATSARNNLSITDQLATTKVFQGV